LSCQTCTFDTTNCFFLEVRAMRLDQVTHCLTTLRLTLIELLVTSSRLVRVVEGRTAHGGPVWKHVSKDRCIAKISNGNWVVQIEKKVGVQNAAYSTCF